MKEDFKQQLPGWQRGIYHGDEEAFNSLFRHYYAKLVHFAMHFVHVKGAAEEVVADVFIKIWERRATILTIANLEVYLFVSVRNRCLNYREKYSDLHLHVDISGTTHLEGVYDPARDLEWKDVLHRLHMAIEQLPEQCRIIFKLVKEDALKHREVAEILGISTRTVETQLYRAVRKIRVILAGGHPVDRENEDDFT